MRIPVAAVLSGADNVLVAWLSLLGGRLNDADARVALAPCTSGNSAVAPGAVVDVRRLWGE
jgi:uncharacterized membrane protein